MGARRHDGDRDVVVPRFSSAILGGPGFDAMRDQLHDLIKQRPSCKLLLDFRKVKYVTSAVMGVMITLHKRLTAAGGCLVLCYVSDDLYKVFEMTKLDRLLRIEDDPEAEEAGTEQDAQPSEPALEPTYDGELVILRFPSGERE